MAREKITHKGIGGSEPVGPSSTPRSTRPGLSDRAAPKIVTKQGMAAPVGPRDQQGTRGWDGEDTGRESSIVELGSSADASAVRSELEAHGQQQNSSILSDAARDELTPAEPTVSPFSATGAGDRSQFKTAPGGGKNRISGGRKAAAAYVSPSTLAPTRAAGHPTAAVKVDEKVRTEAKNFQTEPSLLRRRASTLPAPPRARASHINAWLFGGALVVTLACGALILSTQKRPAQAEPLASGVSAKSTADSSEKRNDASLRPNQPEDVVSPAAAVASSDPAAETPAQAAAAPAALPITEKRALSAHPSSSLSASSPRATQPASTKTHELERGTGTQPQPPVREREAPAAEPPASADTSSNDLWLE